jgi:hypothetical protein
MHDLQAGNAWQQLLYSLELACSGADDLPWLDTLNFMWDSLPDAHKVRAAADSAIAVAAVAAAAAAVWQQQWQQHAMHE